MPPKRGKQCEAIVLVLDVSAAVKDKFLDGQSFLDKTKECVSMILQRKIFSESVDEVGVILFGSNETNNELAEDNKFSDQYQHINVVTEWLMKPTWDMVQNVIKLYPTDISNADWLDAVIVAMQFIRSQSEAKSFSEHKIVLFSNFALDIKSQDQVNAIIASMKSLDIHLTVIGPDITSDYEFSEDSSIKKSETQIEGETLIGRIVNETDGIICTFEQAMSQLMYYEKSSTKPMPWNVQMSIGDDIKIPVSGYKKLAEPKPLKWSKVCAEDNKPLMIEQLYLLGDQDIDREDTIDGYRYGTTIIPYSNVDKEAMKYESGERSLRVLGFTKVDNILLHLLNSYSPYIFVPQRDNQAANLMLTSLVKAMKKLRMAAVASKVYNRGNAPYIGALFPKTENDCAYLIFVQLPFADEVNKLKFPHAPKKQPNKEQLKAVGKLIDSMDLTEAFEDDDDPYEPQNLINPQRHHVNQCVATRALNPDAEIPSGPSETVISMLKPVPEIEMKVKRTAELVKRLFPLKEVKKKLNKKGVSDVFVNDKAEAKDQNNDETTADTKGGDVTMADLVQKTVVTEVGTANPEGNFKELLARGEQFDKVCEQMMNAIFKLILIARASDSISKALSALQTLRESCATNDPSVYNNWICKLKDIILDRSATGHWESITQKNLGLITVKESDKSSVSTEEADEFYRVKDEPDTFNEYDEVDPDALLDEL